MNSPTPEPESITGSLAVDEVLSNLNDHRLYLLLCRLRDWNTNARTCGVAQRVLAVLLKRYPAGKFVELDDRWKNSKNGGDKKLKREKGMMMRDLMEAVERYTERHYGRIEDLVGESYLVEYTLREMEEVGFLAEKDVYGDSAEDVIML